MLHSWKLVVLCRGIFYYLRGFQPFLREQLNNPHKKGAAREKISPATPFLFLKILHVKNVLLESLQVRIVERYFLRQRRR